MTQRTDIDWLRVAYHQALLSPDPSTQNGSVIVPVDGQHPVVGYNHFPQHITPRLERPEKYSFIEHAERDAIYKAARFGIATHGATMYCPWFACADCARAIICAGITMVVGHQRMFDETPDHWKASIADAFTMFEEAGVLTEFVQGKIGCDPIRFNGELWTP